VYVECVAFVLRSYHPSVVFQWQMACVNILSEPVCGCFGMRVHMCMLLLLLSRSSLSVPEDVAIQAALVPAQLSSMARWPLVGLLRRIATAIAMRDGYDYAADDPHRRFVLGWARRPQPPDDEDDDAVADAAAP
jgi:hypothetical protein